ncbi:MAG: M20/M25/M40 family metallo-hydrolase [Thermoplasmata archaeon]
MKTDLKWAVLLVSLFLLLSMLIPLSVAWHIYEGEESEENKIEDITNFPGYDQLVQDMIDEVDEAVLSNYINTLQNFQDENGIPTRVTGSSGFEDSANWSYQMFRSYGLNTFMQNFTSDGYESTNVIAELPGSNPDLVPETLIIGGHFDSINNRGGTEPAPGADDNGSGSVVALETARIMSQYSFERTIRFALWGAEEQGLHGSKYYASNIDVEEEKVMAKLNYDMIGYAEDDNLAVNLHADTQSNWILDYMANVSDTYPDTSLDFTYIYDSTERRSDHSSFWDQGYNATLAIESVFSPYYHSEDDTLDKITMPQVTHTTKHALATLAHLADPVPKDDDLNITITSPTGGEVWRANDEELITWETVQGGDPIESVDLWYSSDSGNTWYSVATDLPDHGSYAWKVPNVHSTECMVRIRVEDSSGGWDEAVSEETFTIEGIPPDPPSNVMVEHYGVLESVENGVFQDDYEPWELTRVEDDGEARWDQNNYEEGGSIYVRTEAEGEGNISAEDSYWEQDLPSTSNEITVSGAFRRDVQVDSGTGWATQVHHAAVEVLVHDTVAGWQTVFLDGETGAGDTGWIEASPVIYEPVGEVDTVRIRMHVEAEGDTGPLGGDHAAIGEIWVDHVLLTQEDPDGDRHNLISWDASLDDPDTVSHYNVYRSESDIGPWNTPIISIDAEEVPNYSYVDIDAGTGDDVHWWYVVRAVGTNGLEGDNEDAVQEPGSELSTFEIHLSAGGGSSGWNFVSFNLIPVDSSLESILEDPDKGISGKYDQVRYYDASFARWYSYVPDRSEHFNSLDTWNHRMGLWIRMTDDAVLTVEGTVPTSTTIILEPGWNMVGTPSESTGNHGLPEEVTCVGYFSGDEESNIAYTETVSTFELEPGLAYWVYNDEDEAVHWEVIY